MRADSMQMHASWVNVGTAGIGGPAMWEFMKDHPIKVSPDPYANAVPSDFPKFCNVGPRAASGGPAM